VDVIFRYSRRGTALKGFNPGNDVYSFVGWGETVLELVRESKRVETLFHAGEYLSIVCVTGVQFDDTQPYLPDLNSAV
jgi:hypothetical protein